MQNSKKIINLAKLNSIMKVSTILKSTFLTSLFVVSSCATTKYSEDVNRNSYTNLHPGKKYVFKMRDGSKSETLIFHHINGDKIYGVKNKKDSVETSIEKAKVLSAKDKSKAAITTGAVVIGAAGAAALVIGASRAD